MRRAYVDKADTMHTLEERLEDRCSEGRRWSPAKTIYVFRSGESGLYAFTADPKGHLLPSRIYPRVRWRLERRVTLRLDRRSPRQQIVGHAIAKHGFHLIHAAIDAELLALVQRCDKSAGPKVDVRMPEPALHPETSNVPG